ncbi:hypothetical protein [Lentilitoribacter sp. EG35]|uniref:hypothetical protein n=1 Tax=Lentilitoribacter sp. EG35 TaxID=3234192 RepID=UPI00346001D7
MSDYFASQYTPYVLFGLFVASVFIWEWFQLHIRPLFITKSEIGRKADELLDRYGGDAERIAFIEEDRTMRYTDTYQQGVWKRVRKELISRL